MRKQQSRAFFSVCLAMLFLLFNQRAGALISEPDAIYYGKAFIDGVQLTAFDTDFTIVLKVDGIVISSYIMGEIPAAHDRYVLKVPLDALDPQAANTARSGDSATISVVNNGSEIILAMVNIGGRGTVMSLDIGNPILDTDGDGVPDAEDAFPLDPTESVDTDGDGIGNNADSDDDNDGVSDQDELAIGRNPLVNEGAAVVPSILILLLAD